MAVAESAGVAAGATRPSSGKDPRQQLNDLVTQGVVTGLNWSDQIGGPAHEPRHTSEVKVVDADGRPAKGVGVGNTRSAARRRAAERLCALLPLGL